MSDLKEVAEYLHKKFCHVNHTDGCGWYYELNRPDTWACYAHARWLKQAEEVVDFINGNGGSYQI